MKTTARFFRYLGLPFFAFAVAACATVTRHGDATLRDNKNILFVTMDELAFPRIPLAHKTTYRYRIRDLPQVIYPQGFYLEVPADEAFSSRHDQPWRGGIIRASLVTPEGAVFFSQTIDLSKDWNGNSSPGRNEKYRSLWLSFGEPGSLHKSPLPGHLSYDLTVQILQPSPRGTDSLRVDAPTLL